LSVECDICQRKFSQNSALTRHIKIVHRKELPYSCDLCQRKFSLNESLKKHKDAIHSKTRGHPCNFCEYAAARADILRIHVRKVHTKEWKFECTLCKENGITWGCILPKELRRHMQTRHADEIAFPTEQTCSDTKDSNASSKDLFIDCSTAHFNKAKSFEALVQSLLNQIQEPVKFTEQLEEEIRAKACRAPRSILGDVKPSGISAPSPPRGVSAPSQPRGISAIHTQQSEFVYQDPMLPHIVSVDEARRNHSLLELSTANEPDQPGQHFIIQSVTNTSEP